MPQPPVSDAAIREQHAQLLTDRGRWYGNRISLAADREEVARLRAWSDACHAGAAALRSTPEALALLDRGPTHVQMQETNDLGSSGDTDVPSRGHGGFVQHSASSDHPPTSECDDIECETCSVRDCPHGEPLHYHHDGCPACELTPREADVFTRGFRTALASVFTILNGVEFDFRVQRELHALRVESAKSVENASVSAAVGTTELPQDSKETLLDAPQETRETTTDVSGTIGPADLEARVHAHPASIVHPPTVAPLKVAPPLADAEAEIRARAWLGRQVATTHDDLLDEGDCRICGCPAGEGHEDTDPCGIVTVLLATLASLRQQLEILKGLVYVRPVLSDDTPMLWKDAHHAASAACETLRHQVDTLTRELATARANEHEAARRLSAALTGGNASEWEHIFAAAEQAGQDREVMAQSYAQALDDAQAERDAYRRNAPLAAQRQVTSLRLQCDAHQRDQARLLEEIAGLRAALHDPQTSVE